MSELITWDKTPNSNITLSDDGLTVLNTSSIQWLASEGRADGKWYWEITGEGYFGIAPKSTLGITDSGSASNWSSLYFRNIPRGMNINPIGDSTGIPYEVNQTIGIILDVDSYTISFTNGEITAKEFDISNLNTEVYYPHQTVSTGTQTANFGATPFKHFTEELMEEGYLPYDYDNAHIDNIPYQLKHLLKSGNRIYTLDNNGRILEPVLSTPPTEDEFLDYGLDSISDFIIPRNKISLEKESIGLLGDGEEFSKTVTPVEFERMIKGMEVKFKD